MWISTEQLDTAEERYHSPEGFPGKMVLTGLVKESKIMTESTVSPNSGNIIGKDENLVRRKEMIAAVSQEPTDFAFERAIGKNDSVYSNFVELIETAKRKVGRIVVKSGSKNIAYATGFMVSERLLLTNWHVFNSVDQVGNSEVQFFYEYDTDGRPLSPVCFLLTANDFFYSSKTLDYCLVAVSPVDVSGKSKLTEIGYVYLDPTVGKLGNEDEEALNIIHHPEGDYKQLSIRENIFVKIMPATIWYKTDTAQGSSGSPVYNDQWQVVALHHMGVGKKNEEGKYIDKNGNIILEVDGKIDASKVVWIANEGIRISVILQDIFSKYTDNPIVDSLKIDPGNSKSIGQVLSPEHEEKSKYHPLKSYPMVSNNSSELVTISFPSSMIEANGTIDIQINNRVRQTEERQEAGKLSVASDVSDDFRETKKLEDAADFSGCKGYLTRFLGMEIPLLEPSNKLKKFIAKIQGTDSSILKYYHYSVLFHSVRMMPVLSAINIEGSLSKRKDKAKRKDVWLRDSRLDFEIQLSDSYYRNSGFDKGHMSRREDADWGSSPEDAKRNADFTCMYTNACPQVATINQSKREGLWGKLELIVLEAGAKKEKAKTAKISVFNGPIFKETDPVYKGIQVPMEFYKIVLWLTDNLELRATAFRLSQEDLVGDISFEELDIDQNVEFKPYQCSIESLQEDTQLDFPELILQADTYTDGQSSKAVVNSEEELTSQIAKLKIV